MPRLPPGWNAEEPGSRFTSRPAVLVGVSEEELLHLAPRDARAAVVQTVGEWILEDHPSTGAPTALDGSTGRGAEAWAPVIEWVLEQAAGGLIGGAATAATLAAWSKIRAAAQHFASMLRRARDERPAGIEISRGMAGILATDAIVQQFGVDGPLLIEAVEEPSSIRGESSPEMNYVGIEPWVAFLSSGSHRYIVVVAPDGQILSTAQSPVSQIERYYYHPELPSDDDC